MAKAKTRQNASPKVAKPQVSQPAKPARSFPRRALEEALRAVYAIKSHNAGNPWSADDLAKAVDISQKSTNYQYLIAAGNEYGVIDGGYRAAAISLTELGRAIAYSESPERELESKREAFFRVPLFQAIFEYYKGPDLPEKKFLSNVLTDKFKVPLDHQDELVDIFKQNCAYLELSSATDHSTARIVHSGPAADLSQRAVRTGAKGQPRAFVIMPFVEKEDHRSVGYFRELFDALIDPAVRQAGFDVTTAQRTGSDVIHSTIINELLDADLVVADLTDHNPNVMFELGLRMGEAGKPVAIIKSSDTGRIFDVDNMLRVYEYNPNLWPSTVSIDLAGITDHVKATWETRKSASQYIQILRRKAEA